jgi:hypothetical protein
MQASSLSPTLKRRLASLRGANRATIEQTIALFPFSHRLALAGLGAIDAHPDKGAESEGKVSPFSLTEKGLKLIEECAKVEA